jgi:imidazolonepropionase-like amidohydrolase
MGEAGTTRIRAGRLIDGTGAEPRENVTITVENGVIMQVDSDSAPSNDGETLDLSGYTVMPGLINMHAHTVLPGDGSSFEAWMENPDEILLLTAFANARTALYSGVTTIRDCGGKGTLMFRLRDAIRAGIVEGPRFVLSGWPLTMTGGHCRYFGGETDGVEGMRLGAREVMKAGADFVKIMASGGGTVGTYSQFPSFEVEELRAAIDEAHKLRKRASCHTIATESISRALDAGTDHIEHCSFMAPDTSWKYEDDIARRVAEQGVYVTATLQVGFDRHDALREMSAHGESLTPAEAAQLAGATQAHANSIANIRNLNDLGVKLVAGNDAGWRHTGFDDFYLELVYLAEAGMTPLQAIKAATGRAAEACQLEKTVGTVAPGKVADLLAVAGDPSTDLTTLRQPTIVLQAGKTVVDRR